MSLKTNIIMKRLIVRLRDEKQWSFEKIKEHVKLSKEGVNKIYNQLKHPKFCKPDKRLKCTNN